MQYTMLALQAAISQAIIEPHRHADIRYLLWQSMYGVEGTTALRVMDNFDHHTRFTCGKDD